MSPREITTSVDAVRRLAIAKQGLNGPLPRKVTSATLLAVVRQLAFVQWDPVTIVAPSHLLSFYARVGHFEPKLLDRLLWKDKTLFLHWTPIASLVLTEDYPLYRSLMRRYPDTRAKSWGYQLRAAKRFLVRHSALRRRILSALKGGPRTTSDFEEHRSTKREEGDWGSASDVSEMLFHLLMSGDVMVVGHRGAQNLWGLSGDFLPNWVDRTELTDREFERSVAQRALRALGTATPREIALYFPRGRYLGLKAVLADLEQESRIHRVHVGAPPFREERYIHDEDVPLLDALARGNFEPRLSLLPPFDTLLGNPMATKRLFDFDYIREQFLPKEKRRYGTYVLPIVWGEKLIGRIDPRFDKPTATLHINAVFAEPGAPTDRSVRENLAEAISGLANFIGAKNVVNSSRVPTAWRSSLH